MRITPEVLAAELATIRDSIPLAKGAKRKKIVYPDKVKEKVLSFMDESGLSPYQVAHRLGLSSSVMTSWLKDRKPPLTFIPLDLEESPSPSVNNASAPGAPVIITWREVSLSLPPHADPQRFAGLVALCRGGVAC